MNELDISNTQAAVLIVIGRYIQLAGVNVWGGME